MSELEDCVKTDTIRLLAKKRAINNRLVLIGCLASIAIVVLLATWLMWAGYASLDAERNLQTTLYAIQLIDRFVNENKRWPTSWMELQSCQSPEKLVIGDISLMFGPWPESADEVKKRVDIDFRPDLYKVAHQDVMEFEAIKPVGRHYPYRDYGFIQQLQKSIQNCIQIHAK